MFKPGINQWHKPEVDGRGEGELPRGGEETRAQVQRSCSGASRGLVSLPGR